MTALSVVAFLIVGVLNARGVLVMDRAGLDPASMMNWARIGIAFSCLAVLLASAIDYVIRHVEHSSRAASEALGDLRLAYERLALVHERLDAAKEEERRFIAGELHDDLGQLLTVIKLRLQMGAPGADTLGLVDQAIDRVRQISRELRPALLDEVGLIPALRDHVLSQSTLAGVPIQLEMRGRQRAATVTGPGDRLLPNRAGVADERASSRRQPRRSGCGSRAPTGRSALTISDDGNGFDTATLAALSAGHLGIIAMQERVRARGGTFAITSAPGAGTRVAGGPADHLVISRRSDGRRTRRSRCSESPESDDCMTTVDRIGTSGLPRIQAVTRSPSDSRSRAIVAENTFTAPDRAPFDLSRCRFAYGHGHDSRFVRRPARVVFPTAGKSNSDPNRSPKLVLFDQARPRPSRPAPRPGSPEHPRTIG